MSAKTEVLLKLHSEELAYARHHSSMRSNVTSLICAIAGAALALAGNDGLSKSDLPLTVFIGFLGLFGVLFSLKQYERGHLHRIRARRIRWALDAAVTGAQVRVLWAEADATSRARHPLLRKIRHHTLWCTLNAAVLLLGVVTSVATYL